MVIIGLEYLLRELYNPAKSCSLITGTAFGIVGVAFVLLFYFADMDQLNSSSLLVLREKWSFCSCSCCRNRRIMEIPFSFQI